MAKELKLSELVIDPEFESCIPPMTQEEFDQLEANIYNAGWVMEPIVVWKRNIIVDGHNRYRIIKKYPGILFNTTELRLETRAEVLDWICMNQLGRRNLTPQQKKFLIGKQYSVSRKSRGGTRRNSSSHGKDGRFTAKCQNDTLRYEDSVIEAIAKNNHVSKSSVSRALLYANGIDAADEVLPGIKQEIFSGKINPTQKALEAVACAAPEDRLELAMQLRQPKAVRKKPLATIEPEIRVPKRKEILALAESMNHSEGTAIGTVEDMMYEMNSALDDLAFRWDFCKETYVKPISSEEGKRQIRELAAKGREYFERWEALE